LLRFFPVVPLVRLESEPVDTLNCVLAFLYFRYQLNRGGLVVAEIEYSAIADLCDFHASPLPSRAAGMSSCNPLNLNACLYSCIRLFVG